MHTASALNTCHQHVRYDGIKTTDEVILSSESGDEYIGSKNTQIRVTDSDGSWFLFQTVLKTRNALLRKVNDDGGTVVTDEMKTS